MIGLVYRILLRPKLALAGVAAVVLLIGTQAPRTQFDASLQSLILENDPDYELYKRYTQVFGQDGIIVIAFEADDVFSAEILTAIRRLTQRIEALDKVYDVQSLTNAEYIKSTSDSFEAVPLVDEIPEPGSVRLADLRRIALKQSMYLGDLISEDGRKTSMIVTFAAQKDAQEDFHLEMRAIEGIVADEAARTGLAVHVMGEKYLDLRFLQYIQRDLLLFVPLTIVTIALLLFMVFRTIRETAIALLAIGQCLLVMAGLVPLMGFKMDSILAGLQPLVLSIAVTDVIHLLHRQRFHRSGQEDKNRAIQLTLKEAAWPCFVNSVTSAIGFGSLMVNDLRPIRAFGMLAALGILACYPVCVLTVGALTKLWDRRAHPADAESEGPNQMMIRFAEFIIRRRWLVAGCSLAAAALCAAGILQLTVQADRVRYLKEDTDLFRSIAFMDRHLSGTIQLDIWIEGGQEGIVKEPALLGKIESLTAFLRQQPGVDKVISINEFVKEMNMAFFEGQANEYRLPATREAVAQYLLIYSMSGTKNQLDRYVDYPYSRTRISVRSSEHNSAALDRLIGKIASYLEREFTGPVRARIASAAIANNNVFHYLVKGLVLDLSTAGVFVGMIMCLMFRSVYAGLVSMIPNILPLAACMGLMGWSNVWLEIATAMTFSIAMGIAVDDTIHLMSFYRSELEKSGDPEGALKATFGSIGWTMFHSSCAVCSGFLILVFASLKMNITFGLLSCFVLLMALLTEAFVLPVCLLILQPFGRGRGAKMPNST